METMEENSLNTRSITWGMVTEAVKLSKLQLRNIFRVIGMQLPKPETAPEPEELLLVLIGDMLLSLNYLTSEQRELILDHADDLWEYIAQNKLSQIVFVDGKYCTWTGQTGFVDITSGDPVDELPVPPIETISYNLNELYRRKKLQIEKRSGLHAKQNVAGNVEESADVRDRPADGVSG
jgi:hypothetical protein